MAEKKKYVSFQKQREDCRLNKYTYEEKCGTCSQNYLMCNYPFPEPDHKKGFCRASTCTDMREIPAEIVEADKEEAKPGIVLPEDHTHHVPGEGESTSARRPEE